MIVYIIYGCPVDENKKGKFQNYNIQVYVMYMEAMWICNSFLKDKFKQGKHKKLGLN